MTDTFTTALCPQSRPSRCSQGINATIFAYGVTSSGKTHTMTGVHGEPGIVPRAISGLFEAAAAAKVWHRGEQGGRNEVGLRGGRRTERGGPGPAPFRGSVRWRLPQRCGMVYEVKGGRCCGEERPDCQCQRASKPSELGWYGTGSECLRHMNAASSVGIPALKFPVAASNVWIFVLNSPLAAYETLCQNPQMWHRVCESPP
eukprot:363588-Chlamydomonas_euryale.AAC.9